MIVYIQTLMLVAIAAGVLKSNRKSNHMNADEQAAFTRLSAKIDTLNDSHEHLKSINASQAASLVEKDGEIAALKAQLEAAPPPPADDSPEVIAAVDALGAKVDAELAADAPTTTPAADPTTTPAAS